MQQQVPVQLQLQVPLQLQLNDNYATLYPHDTTLQLQPQLPLQYAII